MAAADTVARLLADPATRADTLGALEAHDGAHDRATALEAASALTAIMCEDASGVEHAVYLRAGLLAARLAAEAVDKAAVLKAACGGDRLAKLCAAPTVFGRLNEKAAEELTADDALICACSVWSAVFVQILSRGIPKPIQAALGCSSAVEFFTIWRDHPILSL